MLKAIETRYKGHRFRSRLEARWAVFFDALGVTWEYEKDGYDLGSAGYYLPDFWLTTPGRAGYNESHSVWAEVKAGPLTPDEEHKCRELVRQTQSDCILLTGVPDFRSYPVVTVSTIPGEKMTTLDVLLHSSKNRFWWDPSDEDIALYATHDPQYQEAVHAARSARFEHGESG